MEEMRAENENNENMEDRANPVPEEETEVIPPEEAGELAGETSAAAEQTFLEDVEALQQELEETRRKADEYLDGWQRARAEFANYRKRMDREQSQAYQVAVGSVVKRYLEIVDDLERALANRPTSGDGAVWSEGIELIYRKLLSMLEVEGVRPMQVEGEMFDPNLHEAITQEPSDEHESGQVISVVKNGYLLGDRVLRPALVRVAS